VAVLAAIGVAAVLVWFTGGDPVVGLAGWIEGAVGSPYLAGETLVHAAPLVLVALGTAPALRAGIFTVGAEGQITVGAIAATAALTRLDGAPAAVLLTVGALTAAAGGALWALVPALLRLRWNVNEILSTLLLNYLAASLLAWLLRTHMADPAGAATPQSAPLPDAALIPPLLDGTRLHWGVLLAVAAAVGLAWWSRTPSGFAVDAYGMRPALAARVGLTDARAVVGTLVVSGLAGGLAGWMRLAGLDGRLYPTISGGVGFAGVLIAVLGLSRAAGIVPAGLFFAALGTGSNGLQVATGTTPSSIATVTQGVLLLAVAVAVGKRARRRPTRSQTREGM
jgi:simple sugar transport system permease protein